MSRSYDVVVTGVAPVTPIGIGADSFWRHLVASSLAVGTLDRRTDGGPKPPADWLELPQAGAWLGAPIVDFVSEQFVRPRKALKVMSREIQTAFAASALAMEACGFDQFVRGGGIPVDRIATVFGSQMFYGPTSELQEAIQNSRDETGAYDIGRFGSVAMRDVIPLWMLKYLPNMPACHVGISIGAQGANNTIVAGDVSVTSALIESIGVLRRGIADAVICGGSGTMIDSTRMVYRGDFPVPRVADPIEHSSRPHTTEACGVVGGEAAATLVVEFAEAAVRRGVRPLTAVLAAVSRFAAPSPGQRGSAASIAAAIEGALAQAGLRPDDIGMVVSHGMGDPSRDAVERQAIAQTIPRAPLVMPIASLGHSGAAIGGIHLVVGVLALIHRTIPASLLLGTPVPGWEDRFIASPQPLDRDAVLVLSHTGQGVANAVILGSA